MALKTQTPVAAPSPVPEIPEPEGMVVTETKPVEVAAIGTKKKTKKQEKTGNLFVDIATEVESLKKAEALSMAAELADNIDTNEFKLGGILKLISQNSWFEGAETFDLFVANTYGFQIRKARYLIAMYDNLVSRQIPWEAVSHLGWTKLRDLAAILTLDNLAEWVTKAEALTVIELQAAIKASQHEGDGAEKTAKTTADVVTMKFKLKSDQHDTVVQALAKAKGELHTDFDTVALENICAGFLGGNSVVIPSQATFEDQVNTLGFEQALGRIADMFPDYDVVVTPAEKKSA